MNHKLILVALMISVTLLLSITLIERHQVEKQYKSSESYIKGQADMDQLKNLAPEGCSEGMHSANTCEILGYLEYLDSRLDKMERRLEK